MTTQKSFALIVLAALALVASLSPAPSADAPVAGTTAVLVAATPAPSPSPAAPAPAPIETAGGVALAAGAVLAAMASRRKAGFAVDRFGGPTAEVWAAIANTIEVVPGYFEGHLAGRSASGDGSTVWRWGKACPDAAAVLDVVLDTLWQEYPSCPNLIPGCTAYKAAIPGTIDLRQVADLADDTPVAWTNPGHGYQYPTIVGDAGDYVDYTTLIVGPEAGKEVVYTFHPGDPIRPAQVPADVDTTAISTIAALKAAYPEIEWVKVAHTA